MKPVVARTLEDVRRLAPRRAAVTLGVFDGVHLGHRRIIEELVDSRARGAESCHVVTFDPHPLVVTHSKMTPPLLTTVEERLHLLSSFDLDSILVLRFDRKVADIHYKDFLERYLLRPFDMRYLVLGYDCHFGRNREGTPERVSEESGRFGIETRIVPAVRLKDEIVSSTKIRNSLMEGDLESANRLLGHPYMISGRVVKGAGQGRGLGFPTANLAVPAPFKLWPAGGVYAVRVSVGGQDMDGMMNIGSAPTMKSRAVDAKEVEIHLFDFDGDLYGESLLVSCHSFLRNERKFGSPQALSEQLARDKSEALARLAHSA